MPDYPSVYDGSTRFERPSSESVNTRLAWNTLLLPEDRERLNRYDLYWDMYEGRHWTERKIVKVDEKKVTVNYARRFIDKSVSFLFGKGDLTFRFTDDEMDATVSPIIRDSVWNMNDPATLFPSIGQMGGITGDCFIKVVWDETLQQVRIIPLISHYVFPVWNPEDRTKMLACEIRYMMKVPDMETLLNGDQLKYKQVLYQEFITPDRVKIMQDKKVTLDVKNILGEIYVVHIKNLSSVLKQYGMSDLFDIEKLNKELNNQETSFSNIVDYHSAPVTVVYGAKASNLEKGLRKVWGGLPKDARVENLALETDLPAMTGHIERLKKYMHELGNMPERAFGGENAISNTSGIALQIEYEPLLELTGMKQNNYSMGLRDVSRIGAKLYLLKTKEPPKEKDKALKLLNTPSKMKTMEIIYPDPLPKDELIKLQAVAQYLDLGLWTRKKALIYLGYSEDADDLLKAVDEERQAILAEQEAELMGGEPSSPNPQETVSEESQTIGELTSKKRARSKTKEGKPVNVGGVVQTPDQSQTE